MSGLRGAFAQEEIMPAGAIGLAGYFNERMSTGVLDPLFAKVACLEGCDCRVAVVVLDLVGLPKAATELIRRSVEKEFHIPGMNVLVTCTHTHTAPTTTSLFGLPHDEGYVHGVVAAVSRAVGKALRNAGDLTVRTGAAKESGLAFNRRYWMKDGTVVTNPRKGDPDIVKPEGPVDHTVRVYTFESDGGPAGMLVDACNHTDTIGGELISADWPGAMAREINERVGGDFPVLLLNGPAGNINHFDHANPGTQTSPDEAVRIGNGYSDFALEALGAAEEVDPLPLAVQSAVFDLAYRRVSRAEIEAAREIVAKTTEERGRRLTSEELAKGDPQVELIFARGLLDFAELRERAQGERQEIAALRLGEAAFVGFPGEPFVELGLAVKEKSPFAVTTVFSLLGDIAGYIPMSDCFDRGGYEPKTLAHNRFTRDADGIFLERGLELLARLET